MFYKVYMWPDGTWCDDDEVEGCLQWMSDDYEVLELDEFEYDEFLRTH